MYISVQKGIPIEWIVDDAGEYFVVALDYDARTFIFSSKDDIFFKGNLGNSAGSTVVTALPNVTKNYLIYFKKDDQHKYVLDPKVIVNPGPGPDPKGVKRHRISTQGPDPDDYYRCASPCSIEASIQRRRLVFNEERRRYVAVDNGDELQWSIPGVREFTVEFDYDPNNYIFRDKDDRFFRGGNGVPAKATVISAKHKQKVHYCIYVTQYKKKQKLIMDPKVIVNPGAVQDQ